MPLKRVSQINWNDLKKYIDYDYITWSNHIIERFGSKDALKYANSYIYCPCNYLDKKCKKCPFRTNNSIVHHFGCNEAIEFTNLEASEIAIIKRHIRKILKK